LNLAMAPGRIDDAFTAAESRSENEIIHDGLGQSPLYKPRQRPYDPHPPAKVSLTLLLIGCETCDIVLRIIIMSTAHHSWSRNWWHCCFHSDF
jgi:hypothetical protein